MSSLLIRRWERDDAVELLEALREADEIGLESDLRRNRLFAVQNYALWAEENHQGVFMDGWRRTIHKALDWIDVQAWASVPETRRAAWADSEEVAVINNPLPSWEVLSQDKPRSLCAMVSARACRSKGSADLLRCIYEPLHQGERRHQLVSGLHEIAGEGVGIAVAAYRDMDWDALPALADWLETRHPDTHREVIEHLRGKDRLCGLCHWVMRTIRFPIGECPRCGGTKVDPLSRVHGRGCWVLEAICNNARNR